MKTPLADSPLPQWRLILVFSLAIALGASSVQAEEKSLLVCEGKTRNTARIYQKNDTLTLRLYDRQTKVTWFNSPARQATTPKAITYTNLRGENTIVVSRDRQNPHGACSIQIGKQPLEKGNILYPTAPKQ